MVDVRSARTKSFIVALVILFFTLVGLSPTIYEWNIKSRTKPIRFFELVHNFPTDYNFYLSRIRQGKEGAWLAREKYTSEPHDPSLLQVLYVMIGRVSDWAHVQTPYLWFSYHAMRIFFGVFLLYCIWRFVSWHINGFRWQLFSFIVVVTASTWPKLEWVAGYPRFGGYMAWWTQIDSLQRLLFLPHVLVGQALLVFIAWVFAGGFITRRHPGNYIFLGIVGFILGIIFPPALFFLYFLLAVLTVGEVFWGWLFTVGTGKSMREYVRWLQSWAVRHLSGRIIFGVLSLPTFLYFSLLFSQYPWKRLVEYDTIVKAPFTFWEYFMGLGPTFPLGLLGAALLLLNFGTYEARRLRIVVTWVIAWLSLMFIFTQIPQQSPSRFGQMMPQVPLGLLTVYLFMQIKTYLQKRLHLKQWANTVFVIPAICILLGLGTMASSFMWLKDFVDHKLRADVPLVPTGASVMYPLKDLIETCIWLEMYTTRDTVILAGHATSNYIPVYSGNTTFIGHANTVNLEIKQAAVTNFYVRRLPIQEELAWIKQQGIGYIVYGPEEMEMNGGITDLKELYPSLEQVYENTYFRIYKAP